MVGGVVFLGVPSRVVISHMPHVDSTFFMVSAYNCAFIFHSLCIYHCFKSGDQPPNFSDHKTK